MTLSPTARKCVALLLLLVAVCGCSSNPLRSGKAPEPQQGGTVIAELPLVGTVYTAPDYSRWATSGIPVVKLSSAQGENPQSPTVTTYTRETDTNGVVREVFASELGTTQHDEIRDGWLDAILSAEKWEQKMKQYAGIRALGFIVLLAGLGMFWPPAKVVCGNTMQIVTLCTGIGLIFAGPILAGREGVVLVVVLVGLAALFFFRRHGYVQGALDANKNGIPDALEKVLKATGKV